MGKTGVDMLRSNVNKSSTGQWYLQILFTYTYTDIHITQIHIDIQICNIHIITATEACVVVLTLDPLASPQIF